MPISLRNDSSSKALVPGRAPVVLLVEDDDDLRDMLASILRRDCFEVIQARDGREALEMLEKLQRDEGEGPDLIVTDHRMPRRSGLDVVESLRLAHAPTPVILITAFGDDAIHQRAGSLDVAAVLDKPFDVRELIRIARDCTAYRGRGEILGETAAAAPAPAPLRARERIPPPEKTRSRVAGAIGGVALPAIAPRRIQGPLRLDALCDEEALVGLAPEWRALEQRAGGVFQRWAWIQGLWRFERNRRLSLRVLAVRDAGGALVAVLPLALERPRCLPAVRVLRFVGQPLADVQDLLVDPDADAAAVVAEIEDWLACRADEYDLADLRELPTHSPLIRHGALFSDTSEAPAVAVLPSSVCRVLPLPADFEAYEGCLSRNFRKNLRRRRRLLEDHFAVRFEIEDGSRDPAGAIDDLMRLHQARARATGLRGLFRGADRQAAFRELFHGLLQEGVLRIHRLLLDGRVAAADAVLSDGAVATLYIGGFDPAPALGRYSLGTLNVLEVVRWAIQTGHRECDLARGDEPYKQDFQAQARHSQRLLAGRGGTVGALYRLRERAWLRVTESPALRSLYRSLAGAAGDGRG